MARLLIDEPDRPKCSRCQSPMRLPSASLFVPEVAVPATLYLGETCPPEWIESFAAQRKVANPADHGLVVTTDDAVFREAIGAHVLSYKPLLKSLSTAEQADNLYSFVREHWRELRPGALAAMLIALTGLVPGIGANVIDKGTGKPLDMVAAVDAVQHHIAKIQFMLWAALIGERYTSEWPLEAAIADHIRSQGVYGDNLDALKQLIESVFAGADGQKADPLQRYAALAVHARARHVNDSADPLASAWASEYFAFELAIAGDDALRARLEPWRISGSRGHDTISERSAWNAAAVILSRDMSSAWTKREAGGKGEDSEDSLESPVNAPQLDEIADRLGYPGLIARVLSSVTMLSDSMDADKVVRSVRDILVSTREKVGNGWPSLVLRVIKGMVIELRNFQLLDRVLDEVLALSGDDIRVQADAETWYGECLKDLRSPQRFLDRVGRAPRPWERALDLQERLALWNERANALRLNHESDAALAITDGLIREIEHTGERALYARQHEVLMRNRGILLRETGRADESYRVLHRVLEQSPVERRASALESLAMTCLVLRRFQEATTLLNEAIDIGAPGRRGYTDHLRATLAQTLTLFDRNAEAIAILGALPEKLWPVSRLMVAGAYVNLMINGGEELLRPHRDKVDQALAGLVDILKDTQVEGDVAVRYVVLGVLGQLARGADPSVAEHAWKEQIDILRTRSRPLDPIPMIQLCSLAYQRKDPDEVSHWLNQLPGAIASRYGDVADVAMTVDTTLMLRSVCSELLARAFKAEASWATIRSLCEIRRDVLGKARLAKRRVTGITSEPWLITDEIISRAFADSGAPAVLEWSDHGKQLFGVLTVPGDQAKLRTTPLRFDFPEVSKLRDRIVHRLSVWNSGRRGDPFDLSEWREFESWLGERLEGSVEDGRHVIVIDHESLIGIPWHVALSHRWRCSYAPSWSGILGGRRSSPRDALQLGAFAVPRFHDPELIRSSFADALGTVGEISKLRGHPLNTAVNGQADRAALLRLMRECDLLAVFCHGFAQPEEQEIALLIASDGRLPPMYMPGDRSVEDVNRCSWRQLQSLERTPVTVISAACSAGVHWQAGAGEQLGLFGALRYGGTRSFIGPRWDIEVDAVMPIIQDVLRSYLVDGTPMIDAVYHSCRKAAERFPRWLAWSLTLEGDWQ